MKNKIKDALKQKYANLGLGDEVFDRVASSVETIVTDDTLTQFVNGAENLLKKFQSDADKARTDTTNNGKKIQELEAKIKELERGKGGDGGDGGNVLTPEAIAQQVADAVAAAVKPLNDEIASLKGANTAKEALRAAKELFFGGDYTKKFADEANDAWERAMELNEATGSKMTSEELKAKADGYFNKAVSRKGVDTSKPFEGDNGGSKAPDFTGDVKILQDSGLLPKDDTK